MKEQFTQGDWSILATGTHWNNPKLMNLQITYGGIGECICETVYSEDDAHLIAAAPKMYRKLKEIADNNFFSLEINDLLAEARGEKSDTD